MAFDGEIACLSPSRSVNERMTERLSSELDRLTVKNTFIDILRPEQEPSLRRISSAPSICLHEVDSKQSTDVGSVESGASVCADASFSPSFAFGTQAAWFSPLNLQMPGDVSHDVFPVEPEEQTRWMLANGVSNYSMFMPSQFGSPQLHHPEKRTPTIVQKLFAEVVAAARSAVEMQTRVELCGQLDNWKIILDVRNENDFQRAQKSLVAAQKALLQSAAESQSVYVVGYQAAPFQPTGYGSGFYSTLALVKDESLACWDLLSRGVCSRGSMCRWRHPSATCVVTFFINQV
jgi:hypothetical protein